MPFSAAELSGVRLGEARASPRYAEREHRAAGAAGLLGDSGSERAEPSRARSFSTDGTSVIAAPADSRSAHTLAAATTHRKAKRSYRAAGRDVKVGWGEGRVRGAGLNQP